MKIKKYIIPVLLITIIVINLLHFFSNGLDARYVVDPFTEMEDCKELVKLIEDRIQNTNNILLINCLALLTTLAVLLRSK